MNTLDTVSEMKSLVFKIEVIMSQLLFTVSEAAFLADVKVTTLKVWRQRKIVVLESDDARGRWGRFTYADVLHAAIVGSLTSTPNDASHASTVATAARKAFPDVFAALNDGKFSKALIAYFWNEKVVDRQKTLSVEFARSIQELTSLIERRANGHPLSHFQVTDVEAISQSVTLRYSLLAQGKGPKS